MSDTLPHKRVHFISLGCPKNRVDTEVMLGISLNQGLTLTQDAHEADVIVVNTCGFIDSAKQESIDTILEMAEHKKTGACQKLVVTGCLSQRYAPELSAAMPEVDHFLGSSDMNALGKVLDVEQNAARMLVGTPADYLMRASDPRVLSGPTHSAYLKIAEGCNRKCSFCAIPSFRGKQRSRSIADIVEEAAQLVAQGVVEVNLIAQDTMSFGRDRQEGDDLADLLHALGQIEALPWLRLFYLYPEKLNARWISAFKTLPNLLPYLDMPLQHASEPMLKRMRRGIRAGGQKQVVETLRDTFPEATLRTSFIVGHPGETDEDFEQLMAFVEWAEFDRVGVFVYSHEEGTHSGTMTDEVAPRVAEHRYRELMKLQKKISHRKLKSWVGRTVEVMVDGPSDESEFLLKGRHQGQAPDVDGHVVLGFGPAWLDRLGEEMVLTPGAIVRAHITGSSDYDLTADMVDLVSSPKPLRKPKKRLQMLRAHTPTVD